MFCRHMYLLQVQSPHPSPIPSDWSSKDWDGEKAKAREQRSLIDFDPPKPVLRQMTDSEILNDLPIQNLTIQEDEKEEKSPEITDTTTRSITSNTSDGLEEQENIVEKKDIEGLTDKDATERGRRVCH